MQIDNSPIWLDMAVARNLARKYELPFWFYYQKFADDITKSDILAGELPKRTSVGELCDEYGNDYIFILNRDFYKGLDAQIKLKCKFNVYEVSRKDGKQYLLSENVDSLDVKLDCGDAILLRMQKAGEELCTVSYICED